MFSSVLHGAHIEFSVVCHSQKCSSSALLLLRANSIIATGVASFSFMFPFFPSCALLCSP